MIALLFLLFTPTGFAKNYITLMGGGGEPQRDHTIFDHEVQNVTRYISSNNWDTKVAYNGGHKNTEKILAPLKSKSKVEHFTSHAYDKIIDDYVTGIKSGKITKNDQLILYISSHGAGAKKGEKTHSISTTGGRVKDFNTLAGSSQVSLDRLQELATLANQRGIKLGIIDMSCHSGSSLALANNNTCVITSTGPNHFAWGGTNTTFAAQFSQGMSRGRSLEDVFIAANARKTDISFPMISSAAGIRIQNELYQEISPYLYDARDELSKKKMLSYYDLQYTENKCSIIDQNYTKLNNFVSSMERVVTSSYLSDLRGYIDDYYELQKQIRATLNLKNSPPLNEAKRFCSNDGKECASYSIFNILQMDTTKSKALLEKEIKNNKNAQSFTQKLEILKALDSFKVKHQLTNSSHAIFLNNYSQNLQRNTSKLSRAISTELQKIYPRIYAQYKKGTPPQNNPCAKIKL